MCMKWKTTFSKYMNVYEKLLERLNEEELDLLDELLDLENELTKLDG